MTTRRQCLWAVGTDSLARVILYIWVACRTLATTLATESSTTVSFTAVKLHLCCRRHCHRYRLIFKHPRTFTFTPSHKIYLSRNWILLRIEFATFLVRCFFRSLYEAAWYPCIWWFIFSLSNVSIYDFITVTWSNVIYNSFADDHREFLQSIVKFAAYHIQHHTNYICISTRTLNNNCYVNVGLGTYEYV